MNARYLLMIGALSMITLACQDVATSPEIVGDFDAKMQGPRPDRVVFTSTYNGNQDIYRVDVDGTNMAPVTSTPEVEVGVKASPDGMRVAYVSGGDIYWIDVDGGTPNFVAQGFAPAWSPDGTQIAFSRNIAPGSKTLNFELFVINIDGTGEYRVTDNSADDREPTWSPDGTQLAFASNRSGGFGIYTIDSNCLHCSGAVSYAVTTGRNPAWSPDGTRIAYTGWSLLDHTNDQIYVMTLPAMKGKLTVDRVTTTMGEDRLPSWSSDGSRLYFVRRASYPSDPPVVHFLLTYDYSAHQLNNPAMPGENWPSHAAGNSIPVVP